MPQPIHIPNVDLLKEAEDLVRKDPSLAIERLTPILSSADSTPLDRVRALLLVARGSLFTGRVREGEEYARQALTLARQNGLRRYEGLSQNEIGVFRFVAIDYEGALGHYAVAEQLLADHGTELDLGKVYLNMGNVYHRSNDEILAIQMYERVQNIAERTGDVLAEAKVSTNLAGMYGNVLYDNETAIRYSRRAIELYESLGDQIGLGKAFVNLAHHLRESGQKQEAIEYYHRSKELRRTYVEPSDFFTMYRGLIVVTLQLGDIAKARTLFREANEHPYAQQNLPGVEFLKEVEASILVSEERYPEALALIVEIEAWINQHQAEEMRSEILRLKAACLREVGRADEAIATLETLITDQARTTKRRAEQRLVQMRAHFDLVQARTNAEVERLRNVELAAALEESTRLQRQNEEYLAFMAHELKSPLTTIRSIANLLKSDQNVNEHDRSVYSSEVFDISTRMFDLINQVLERGREVAQKEVSRVDVATIWGHVLGMWRHRVAEKQIKLETSLVEGPVYVSGPEGSMVSILDNLISNAVKFSNVGSRIDVSTRGIPNTSQPTSLLLSVRDQGPGLTALDLSRLFTPFGRLSAKPTSGEDSTGLGLLIVKREAEALGGRVWCESIAGQGATFFVELPLANSSEQSIDVKRTS